MNYEKSHRVIIVNDEKFRSTNRNTFMKNPENKEIWKYQEDRSMRMTHDSKNMVHPTIK